MYFIKLYILVVCSTQYWSRMLALHLTPNLRCMNHLLWLTSHDQKIHSFYHSWLLLNSDLCDTCPLWIRSIELECSLEFYTVQRSYVYLTVELFDENMINFIYYECFFVESVIGKPVIFNSLNIILNNLFTKYLNYFKFIHNTGNESDE